MKFIKALFLFNKLPLNRRYEAFSDGLHLVSFGCGYTVFAEGRSFAEAVSKAWRLYKNPEPINYLPSVKFGEESHV